MIDHAYSNKVENIVDVYIPCYAISDHYPIYLTRKLAQCKTSEQGHQTITYRVMRSFDQKQLLQNLEYEPCVLLDTYDDPSNAMDFFNKCFENVLNRHAPKKTKTCET